MAENTQSALGSNDLLCQLVPEIKYVMAGWGCCRCRVYNGVWRENCKQCFHLRCIEIPQEVIDRQNTIRAELGYTAERLS